jgi:hypothetical protein
VLPPTLLCCAVLCCLQGGDTAVAAPILWAAQELAAPLSDKLLHHFANDMPPGAVERPQWLLNTVLRLCREYAPRLEFLQVGGVWG